MYYIYHPLDKLHKIWVNSFIESLITKNIEFKESNEINIKSEFFNNLKIEKDYKNDNFIYICHPIELLNNIDINNIKNFMNNIKIKKILYITEPLNLLIYKKTYNNLIIKYQISELWTYSIGNILYYKPLYNINFIKKTIEYNKSVIFLNNINDKITQNKIKNINKIVFFGNVNIEREKIINKFGDDIIVLNNIWNDNDYKELFEKYTYFLNVHRTKNCKCLETFRIIPIIYNFGFVLSEKINQEEELDYNKNIIYYESEKLYDIWLNIKNNNSNENVLSNLNSIYNNTLLLRNKNT